MNSYPTVTANSALSQNWVGCTVRTPKIQVAGTLRVQCPCRGRWCAHSKLVERMLCAQPTQVARIAPRSWAHVATSLPFPVKPPRSRHRFHVTTSWRPSLIATSHWCRDIAQPTQVATPEPGRDLLDDQVYVATSSSCCDLNSQQVWSRRQFPVATSWRLTYVTTSISCRNIASAHNGHSRPRHRNPCRDLPHCRPCRDTVSAQQKQTRSRFHFLVATSLDVTHVATSK